MPNLHCKSPTSATCYTAALRDHFDAPSLSSKGENYLSSEDFIDSQIRLWTGRLSHPSPVAFCEYVTTLEPHFPYL